MNARDAAAAYDAIAATYDDLLAGDAWMRSVLWSRYARLFGPGDHVLDVGCGTGADALFLAGRGMRVLGIDVSPAMVDRLREKAATQRLDSLVDARVMDLAEIASLPAGSFDAIISAFAGLSSTPDLSPFASDASRLLRPGGRMIVHMLNRTSLWEWLGAATHGELATAREVARSGQRDFTIGGIPVRHHLYRPHEAYARFFRPHFLLTGAFGLGSLRPPHTVRRLPLPIHRMLGQLERFVAHRRPFLNWGRFFVLEMVKR